MYELMIPPTQSPPEEHQIEEVVEQFDAVDLALGQHLAPRGTSARPAPIRRRQSSPQWYRARIAEWCRDPGVRATHGTEAVVSTALTVPHLTDEELRVFVHDLIDRASAAAIRGSTRRRTRRRAV